MMATWLKEFSPFVSLLHLIHKPAASCGRLFLSPHRLPSVETRNNHALIEPVLRDTFRPSSFDTSWNLEGWGESHRNEAISTLSHITRGSIMRLPSSSPRRDFLKNTALAGASLVTPWHQALPKFNPVSAAEANAAPSITGMEPVVMKWVKTLESTPRDRLVEEVAHAIKKGKVSYREILCALFLSAVKHVQPRPSVGFKFHAVLVVHSAHLASINSPAQDRWLPILWAIDQFKSAQARDVREGNWTMSAVREAGVPSADQTPKEFEAAMIAWDEARADTAAAGIARHLTKNTALELFAKFAARDYRSIGHKVIYVANAFRTLEVIGWQYAEPILRSLAYALLNHVGESNPAKSNHTVDEPWKQNATLADELPHNWMEGETADETTCQIVTGFREWKPLDAGKQIAELLNGPVSLQSVVDGLYLTGSELMMRQPGIISLHSLTTTNAIQYLVNTVQDESLRRRLILQNASFLPFFLQSMRGRGPVNEKMTPFDNDALPETLMTASEIFESLGNNPDVAYSNTRRLLKDDPSQFENYIREARRLIFLKGTDSHDYKYSSAIMEDIQRLSPRWQPDFAAACIYKLRSPKQPTTTLVKRIQTALA